MEFSGYINFLILLKFTSYFDNILPSYKTFQQGKRKDIKTKNKKGKEM